MCDLTTWIRKALLKLTGRTSTLMEDTHFKLCLGQSTCAGNTHTENYRTTTQSKSYLAHFFYFSAVIEKSTAGTSQLAKRAANPQQTKLAKSHTAGAWWAASLAMKDPPTLRVLLSSPSDWCPAGVPSNRSRGLAEWNSYRKCGKGIEQQDTSAAPQEQGPPPSPSWEGLERWAPSPTPQARSVLNLAAHNLKSPLPQRSFCRKATQL